MSFNLMQRARSVSCANRIDRRAVEAVESRAMHCPLRCLPAARLRAASLARRAKPWLAVAGIVVGMEECSLAAAAPVGKPSAANAVPADFSPPPIDSSFERALAVVKKTDGLRETNFEAVLPAWTPGLCMLVGFRTDIDSKRFVHLVEVTTLPPVETDARGRPRAAPMATASFTCTWTNRFQPAPRTHKFSSRKYPVRVRLYDANGKFIKESREEIPWGFLTNGLMRVCPLMKLASLIETRPTNSLPRFPTGLILKDADARELLETVEIIVAESGLALGGLFSVIGDADALDDVREHATAVVRPPNFLRVLFELKLDLTLDPKFGQAVDLPRKGDPPDGARVRFPVLLRQGKRVLTHVEFIAGSTGGAYFLTSGVRALRATHPIKKDRSLLAQVLAVGLVP